jgi:putative phosphoesterase
MAPLCAIEDTRKCLSASTVLFDGEPPGDGRADLRSEWHMAAREESTDLESGLTVPPLRLLLISDTHLPNRARELPTQVWDAVVWADIVIHAGDWVQESLLDQLAASAARVIGVWGNNDGDALRNRLPEVATSTIEGIRFAVVHETGPAAGREARCDSAFPDTDVLVFGHSHIPWDTTTPRGLRLLNPGSPTDRRRQPNATFITAVAQSGLLRDVQLVDVVR